jgi:hypothetical protein
MKGFRTPSWFRAKGLSKNNQNKIGTDQYKAGKEAAKKKA